MNILDYIIIAFLLYLVIRGIFRGIIRETFSLLGIILGLWLGNHFQPWLTGILKQHLPFPSFLPLLSFILLFIGILVICNLIGWALKHFFPKAFTGWADMTFGSVMALIKGVVITYLIIVLLTFYLPEKTSFIANSTLAPWIIKSYQTVSGFISPDHYKNWKKSLTGESQKIKDSVTDKIKDVVK